MPLPPGRDGLRELLRAPAVRLALGVTAFVQFAAVGATGARSAPAPTVVAAVTVTAAVPRKAAPPVAAGGQALASEYRDEGYHIPPQLAEAIHDAALENGIDPDVAFGLVRTESSFQNSATSSVGALGLTQLMPSTARWLEPGTTKSDLRDPETNLRIGFKYLRQLIDRYDGNTRMALLAYNRGPGTVDRVLQKGGNPDNGYASMVMDR